jgi:nucleoside-diphosphate-sugar epimerase
MRLSRGDLLASDLDEILQTVDSFEKFRDSRILILGGTGFVGTWIISALLHANEVFSLNLSIHVITRDLVNARSKLLFKINDPVSLIEFNLKQPTYLLDNSFDFYIHAATPSLVTTGSADGNSVSSASFGGANLISENISKFSNSPSVLHTSSGAVYGKQEFVEKLKLESPAKPSSALANEYAKVKVSTEMLLNDLQAKSGAKITNPRLFAFAGPRIELNEHFAIGNFLRDGLSGHKIMVKGSPETIRSYLYPTDLTAWLILLLANPSSENLNIGSETSYSMLQLATLVSTLTSNKGFQLLNPDSEASIYAPSTSKTREMLKVRENVTLENGLERWIQWLELTKK